VKEEQVGPGVTGLVGMVCLGVVVAAVAVMAPLPAFAWVALLGAGLALTGFAAFRTLRSPA
jgi:hypothetical protein